MAVSGRECTRLSSRGTRFLPFQSQQCQHRFGELCTADIRVHTLLVDGLTENCGDTDQMRDPEVTAGKMFRKVL